VSVDVQRASLCDPFSSQLLWLKDEPFVPPAQNCALTVLVHQDERLRTGGFGYVDEASLNACPLKLTSV
jgi:hypothetical protein